MNVYFMLLLYFKYIIVIISLILISLTLLIYLLIKYIIKILNFQKSISQNIFLKALLNLIS